MKRIVKRNFDISTDEYDAYERQTRRFETLAERLFETLERHHSGPLDTILDAGAGRGHSTRVFMNHAQVVALDFSRSMLADNPATDLLQGDIERLPLGEDGYDAVLFSASLFLTAEPTVALEEAKRVVRPDGTVGAVIPLGWFADDGTDVFSALERESRSPHNPEDVETAMQQAFSTVSGEFVFPTTSEHLQLFHRMPAAAARIYPDLDPERRVERATELLSTVDGPLEQRWRWVIGR